MNRPVYNIGISISEPEIMELGQLGMSSLHLQDAMVETARFLLRMGYNISYGGDLNYDSAFNFTELLIQLSAAYGGLGVRVKNYLAFPLYIKIPLQRRAELIKVAQLITINPSPEFDNWSEKIYENLSQSDRQYIDDILNGYTSESDELWKKSLTAMRTKVSKEIQCQIVMGGKLKNHKGVMPGAIEEVLLSINNNVTVFLDGSFGGASLLLVKGIINDLWGDYFYLKELFKGIAGKQIQQFKKNKIMISGSDSFDEIKKFLINY